MLYLFVTNSIFEGFNPSPFAIVLSEGDAAGLTHGRRGTASSPEDGVRVNPLRRLYAGLRRWRLAEVPSPFFLQRYRLQGGGMFRPTVRRIWTCPAIQLHRSLALPLPSSPP